jgi:hypothetical protein
MWHCTCDVAETLSLATAVTSAVASCCSVFGTGAMSAAVAACTDSCMWLPSFAYCVAPQWYPPTALWLRLEFSLVQIE